MKTKRKILVVAFLLLSVISIDVANGQTAKFMEYKFSMGFFGQRRYERSLLKVDETDMTLTTEEILNIKDDIRYISSYLEDKSASMMWWVTIPTCVLSLGGGIASGAGGTAAGLVMLGVGVTYGLVGYCTMLFYNSRAQKLDNKYRLLLVDAIPLISIDNLALNVSIFHNNHTNSNFIGPGISINF